IDQAMLATEGEAPRAIVDRTWVMPGAYGRRKVNLAHVVAVHTGCAGYFAREGSGGYRFCVFGFTTDVEWAETLFFSLCHQAEAGSRPRRQPHPRVGPPRSGAVPAPVNPRERQLGVYAGEEAALAGAGRIFRDLGEVRAYLDDLVGSDWWADRWPHVEAIPVA